jgi:hypothetical protein
MWSFVACIVLWDDEVEEWNAYNILGVEPEVKRALEILKCKWVDNIKVDMERENGMIWIGLIWLWKGSLEGLCYHGSGI